MGLATTIALIKKSVSNTATNIVSGFSISHHATNPFIVVVGSGSFRINGVSYTFNGADILLTQVDTLLYIDTNGVYPSNALPSNTPCIKLCDVFVSGTGLQSYSNVASPIPNYPDNNHDNIADDANNLEKDGVEISFERIKDQTFFKDTDDTDDITEGATNLFFTDDRAKDSVGNTLVDTNSIDLQYNTTTKEISANFKYTDTNSIQITESITGVQADVNYQDSTTIQLSEDINGLKADIINDSIDATQIKPNADLSSKNVKVQSTIDITDGTNTYNATDIANVITSLNNKQNKITIDSVIPTGVLDDLFIDISATPYSFYRHDGTTFNLIGGSSSGTGNGFDYEVNTDVDLLTLTPALNETVFIRNYNSTNNPTIGFYDGTNWVVNDITKAQELTNGVDTYTATDIKNLITNVNNKQNKIIIDTVTPVNANLDDLFIDVSSEPYKFYRFDGNTFKQIGNALTGANGFSYEVNSEADLSTLTPNVNETVFIRNYNSTGKPIIGYYGGLSWIYIGGTSLSAEQLSDGVNTITITDIQTMQTNINNNSGKVLLNATDTLGYMDSKIDNTTIQSVGNQLIVKNIDGLNSTVTQIDQAVTDSHVHTRTEAQIADAVDKTHQHLNEPVISAISDNGGQLYYNGVSVANPLSASDIKILYESNPNTFTFDTLYKNKVDSMPVSFGDMLMSTYDTDGDGKINSAVNADNANTLVGLTATLTELNFLQGLTSNVQGQINAITSGMDWKGEVGTYALLLSTYPTPSRGYTVIVTTDETHAGSRTFYTHDGTTWVYLGEFTVVVRDFLTQPIDLSTETTGVLQDAKIPSNIARITDLHSHANKPVIDQIGKDPFTGKLTFEGLPVSTGGGGGGGSSLILQRALVGLTATPSTPHVESIAIPSTANYASAYVNVLKYVNGVQNQVIIVNDFVEAEKANSTASNDDMVIFDGKMHLKTTETKPMTEEVFGTGKLLTIPIDRNAIKKIEKIEII